MPIPVNERCLLGMFLAAAAVVRDRWYLQLILLPAVPWKQTCAVPTAAILAPCQTQSSIAVVTVSLQAMCMPLRRGPGAPFRWQAADGGLRVA